MALNGGSHDHFTTTLSLFVNCTIQAEVDELWEKLTEAGEEAQCGWLTNKLGLQGSTIYI
jgi:predicted 3-demethylubiquinone-9 3-methyltransferase (glyoxalase superfamily)